MESNERKIKAKQTLAQHRRGISGREVDDPEDDRLPPGQHLVNNFPVLDLGFKPDISLDEWNLTIDGFVANPVTWSWNDFQDLPTVEMVSDFHCVTTWSMLDCAWKGIPFQYVIQMVRPLSSARFVLFEAYDDYTTNLPLEVCNDKDVLLATHWNGKTLSRDHGWPVRMLIPKRYGWKGAKWVKKITFSDRDQKGFWEVRGYSNTALPWNNDRYA